MGSSVIDGHSGYKNNRPAVFDNLYKLQKGDKIYVEDEKGITHAFVVREFHTYGLNDDVSSVFNSNDGVAHLNLITCSGVWNDKEKTHATRLIVFTDLTL
jgi:LPXTG-site transpeptidase (sortase) family protein